MAQPAPTNVQTQVKDGHLVIALPILSPSRPSKTGKNRTVASTWGNVQTTTTVEGKPVTIGVNAYIPA